jgi:predicted RNase H-like HicB family nuclease
LKNRYTAVIKQDEGWWIGWVAEVAGVNCQAKTRAGLVRSLRVTLKEALEMNRQDARVLAGESMEEELILM